MIRIGYIFKPKVDQVDRVARVVSELRTHEGCEELNISKFYDLAVENTLDFYRHDPEECVEDVRTYLARLSQVM